VIYYTLADMRKIVAGVLVAAASFALVGCSAINQLPGVHLGNAGGSSTKQTVAPVACVDGKADYVVPASKNTLTTDCANVTISGSNITVTAEGVTKLVISGNNDTVGAAIVGGVMISGQNNTVKATGVGPLTISGNNDAVTTLGSIGAVVIVGNNNTVTSPGAIASVEQSGTGNVIVKG
jgi:hypothetical protein